MYSFGLRVCPSWRCWQRAGCDLHRRSCGPSRAPPTELGVGRGTITQGAAISLSSYTASYRTIKVLLGLIPGVLPTFASILSQQSNRLSWDRQRQLQCSLSALLHNDHSLINLLQFTNLQAEVLLSTSFDSLNPRLDRERHWPVAGRDR